MGLFFTGELFLSFPKAQAAGSIQENLDLARTIVSNISWEIQDDSSTDSTLVSFSPDGFLSKPLVAETIITREEKKNPQPLPKLKQRTSVVTQSTVAKVLLGNNHFFPYGYCTYYVSQRRNIPWSGNAISWLSGARSFGFATGKTPQVGAIIVTSEGGRTGHVGMVDGVNGNQITITEMNYHGFGVISQRTISSSYRAILGYIY